MLVVSDIDGTLITAAHDVRESTRQVITQLEHQGIALALCSSRPPGSIRPLARMLALRAPSAAFNGALICAADGRILQRSTIPAEVAGRLRRVADELDLGLWLYDEERWWVDRRDAFVEREERTSGLRPVLEGYAERLRRDVTKMTVVGHPGVIMRAEERVKAELTEHVSASRSRPRFLDVTRRGVDKGFAVRGLARLLGIERAQIAAIGDGLNDVDMFREAAVSIAMGQSPGEVAASATFTTSSNEEDGWSDAIRKYVLDVRNAKYEVDES